MRGQQLIDHYILLLTTNVSCVKNKRKDDYDVLHKQHIECILYCVSQLLVYLLPSLVWT